MLGFAGYAEKAIGLQDSLSYLAEWSSEIIASAGSRATDNGLKVSRISLFHVPIHELDELLCSWPSSTSAMSPLMAPRQAAMVCSTFEHSWSPPNAFSIALIWPLILLTRFRSFSLCLAVGPPRCRLSFPVVYE